METEEFEWKASRIREAIVPLKPSVEVHPFATAPDISLQIQVFFIIRVKEFTPKC